MKLEGLLVRVKPSVLLSCCMGMEPELDGANGMRSGDPLARRLAEGDPGAPGEMVERHHAELYRYAWALLRDTPAAEDAVQEAFRVNHRPPRRRLPRLRVTSRRSTVSLSRPCRSSTSERRGSE